MSRILITGMSGNGKTSVLKELAQRGCRTVETDEGRWSVWTELGEGHSGWLWDEERMAALLAEESPVPLFVSGCVSNQGRFYDRFDKVVLLSAPLEVVLQRVKERANNPYGKTLEQQAEIALNLREVELLLRRGADIELDSSRLSITEIADELQRQLL